MLVGDFNIDLLPADPSDHWASDSNRAASHKEARLALYGMLDSTRGQIAEVAGIRGTPISAYSEAAWACPFTRIPHVGERETRERPSHLDYVISHISMPLKYHIIWDHHPADHATISCEVPFVCKHHKESKFWTPTADIDYAAIMALFIRERTADLNGMISDIVWFQRVTQSQAMTSAADAHASRLPAEVRAALTAAQAIDCHIERGAARKAAWQKFREILAVERRNAIIAKCEKGHAICSVKNLKEIQCVERSNGTLNHDQSSMLDAICGHFNDKWSQGGVDKQARLQEILDSVMHVPGGFTENEVYEAVRILKPKSFLAADGTCMRAWILVGLHMKPELTSFINSIVNNKHEMAKIQIHSRVYGKGTSRPKLKEIRAILPLPPIAGIIDVLVANKLDRWLSQLPRHSSAIYTGGTAFTQCLDIAHGGALWLEKGGDNKTQNHCIAQCDIATYYDTINPTAVLSWATSQGSPLPWWIGTAAVQLMLQPSVVVQLAGGKQHLRRRTGGTLTGSRVAGMLGRHRTDTSQTPDQLIHL